MKTKEEIKAQVAALIDAAYNLGLEAGKATVPADTPSTDSQIQEPAIVCNVTNEAVSRFLADTSYDAPGFATGKGESVVCKYCEKLNTGNYATNLIEHPLPAKVGSALFWNLIPGREYSLDGKLVKGTGTLRQIHFDDPDTAVANCRDLGGWKCEGGHVAYGKIIRSARLPEGLTKTSSTAVTLRDDVGVTLEIDLRNKAAYTTLGWRGMKISMYGYASILTDARGYKDTFTAILNEVQKGGCALIHCNAGADRTGTVAALILGLLGVSEADIIKDWELTSFCHWENYKLISQWASRIADPAYKAIALEEFPKGELREFFQAMKAAYGKNGETFQQQVVAFLTKKVGLSTSQLSALKKAFVQA